MKPRSTRNTRPHPAADGGARPLAVIELGTTSVRMLMAQRQADGELRVMETLQQPVTLGKDTFTQGFIGVETTQFCVEALKRFRRVLRENAIDPARDVRAIATSAVREAANRQAFLDRIYVATGFDVEDLATTEVSRFTSLAVRPLIRSEAVLRQKETVVVEVGGGSTEILHLRMGRVVQAHVFRLGSLRLREMLDDHVTPAGRLRELLVNHVDRGVRQILQVLPLSMPTSMLALGGDARWAAAHLPAEPAGDRLVRLAVRRLAELNEEIMRLTVDEVVQRQHVSYPDAETLGPALLVYTRLAKAMRLEHVLVGNATLREGVLAEMSGARLWTPEYLQEVADAAVEVGRKFHFEEAHALNTAAMARHLFKALHEEHGLSARHELILSVAAILHDIGLYVSTRSHHKHSMYLILNSDIFGLRTRDQMVAALVARYHRRALPDPAHELYTELNREERVEVLKLAAILRVADALDCRLAPRVSLPDIAIEPGRLRLTLRSRRDVSLEQHALRAKGDMFRHVYGMDVVVQNLSKAVADARNA